MYLDIGDELKKKLAPESKSELVISVKNILQKETIGRLKDMQ